MSRSPVLTGALAGVVLAAGVGGWMFVDQWRSGSEADDGAHAAASAFARGVQGRSVQNAPFVGTSGTAAAQNFSTATASLGRGPVTATVGQVRRSGETATAQVRITWKLSDGTSFSWTDPVDLARSGDTWGVKVPQSRSLWHPDLSENGRFQVAEADTAQRGEILGRGGSTLVSNQKVHDVSVDPRKATPQSLSALRSIVGGDDLTGRVDAAKKANSSALLPVITYRESDYLPKSDALADLDGVVTSERTQPLATTRTFGQPLLGTVGRVTEEMIAKDPKLRAGQVIGRSGLQSRFESTLAPTGGLRVSASDSGKVLHGAEPTPGKNLQTTLDPRVQNAAEQALSSVDDSPAALVATDVRTGTVLAVANTPTSGINRALSGRYQPGSTLKVSTTYALLTSGFDPNTAVPCPGSITVEGRRIGNFEQETLPEGAPFTEAFAHSCNTAFVQAAKPLSDDAMTKAAKALGIGTDWTKQLGVPAYTGSVPPTTGAVDHAAESFGQARTLTSPLSVTVMTGSIARGNYLPPALIGNGAGRTATPLDGNAVNSIRGMMRKVVTDGTGSRLKDAPGGDVYAKTGTAEFDGKDGPESRAWLTGWQGDIAFTVFIEEVPLGSGGGDRAAPVAKHFLTKLNQG